MAKRADGPKIFRPPLNSTTNPEEIMLNIRTISVACAVSVLAISAHAHEVTLRMANHYPPAHHMTSTMTKWIDLVSEATNGEVKIELMTTPLAPAPGQYDLVKNGIVDVATSFAAVNPTRFSKLKAIEIPFLSASAETGSAALYEWYTEHELDEEEFDGTHLVAAFVTAPFLVHSRQPLETLDQLNGLKIRAGGIGIEIFSKLGAAPVFLSPAETTEALQRGTVDATQFTWESLEGYRLTDIATHHLVIPDGGLYPTVHWLAINENSWNRLSDEQRSAIEGIGVSGSRFIGQQWDAAEVAGREAAVANGNTIVTLSEEDTARLKEEVAFVEENWILNAGDVSQNLLDDLKSKLSAQ